MKTPQDIEGMFDPHSPTDDGTSRHLQVRSAFKHIVMGLDAVLPEANSDQARCKALVMTKLEEAAMWANKSVAYLSDTVPTEVSVAEPAEEVPPIVAPETTDPPTG